MSFILTGCTLDGSSWSSYDKPFFNLLLATACKSTCGLTSDALPILKFCEPGCIIIINCDWICYTEKLFIYFKFLELNLNFKWKKLKI